MQNHLYVLAEIGSKERVAHLFRELQEVRKAKADLLDSKTLLGSSLVFKVS